MFNHRKFTAFIMSLLICSSAAAVQAYPAYATGTSEDSSVSADIADDIIVSGDFSYSLTPQETVCIESYSGSDAEISVPDELDGIEVTHINRKAFDKCSAASIHIPASVTYLSGDNPFLNCTELKEITVDENNKEYTAVDGVLYSKDKMNLLCYPQAKEGTSFTVPDGVDEIGIAAIYQTKLTEIILPESVKSIERHAFSYNTELKSIDLSGTDIVYIGEMSLAYSTALSEIIFPETLYEIADGAFAGCTALTDVSFPDMLAKIGQNAFAATGLTEVTIPPTVTEIGYCAFGYDENLNPIDTFTIIGATNSAAYTYATDADEDYGYANNFNFKTIEQSDTENALDDLESIPFGNFTYAEVDGEAYITACTSVESVIEVPSEIEGLPVTCIYAGAFYQNNASEIILPDTLKTIETIAFYICPNLKTITIPDGVTEIKKGAFDSCTSLTTVNLPGTCETIGEDVFLGCRSIEEFNVSGAEGGNYSSEDGVLYSKDKSVLVAYPAGKSDKKFTAPKETKEILQSAFSSGTNLETVDISSVTTIRAYAFEGCSSLKSVKLSEDLEKVEAYAFYDCTSLLNVRLYNAKELGTCSFGYCYDAVNGTDKLVEGFRIHAAADSDGHRYSQICEIECVTDTISIFGFNVVKGFSYTIMGVIAAGIVAAVGIIIGKSVKRKKSANPKTAAPAERKDNENETE